MKKKKQKTQTKKAYLCGTAWLHELGETNVSLKHTLKGYTCTDECGLVEVEVKLKKWIKKPTL